VEHEVNGEERPGADLLMMTLRGIVARTSLQRGSVVIQIAALHQTPTGQRHACSRSTPNRNEGGPARTAVAHTAICWTPGSAVWRHVRSASDCRQGRWIL